MGEQSAGLEIGRAVKFCVTQATNNQETPPLSSEKPSTASSGAALRAGAVAGDALGAGVKAECSNCEATHTPLWRRGLNNEVNCNACGFYCKLHQRPRPKAMRNMGEGKGQSTRAEVPDVMAQCLSCRMTKTTKIGLWATPVVCITSCPERRVRFRSRATSSANVLATKCKSEHKRRRRRTLPQPVARARPSRDRHHL
ncbi:unnamed protein product [Mycena citricolor]|uniref:GATA-type domain-containing protein n=1 Tax=Mycena citricolor TaxID=2018698 RepID=A0AAD2HUJ9_9AGAR|nr:unnamed protein product [Mycena citricolor]